MMTQTENENVARVKRGFEAFNTRDMATLAELFDENVKWLGPRTGILAGTYTGRDALFAAFGQLGQESGGTFSSKPLTFAGAGDEVFVNVNATGERKGRKLDTDEVLIFTLGDGRVRQVRFFLRDHAAAEAFWS